MPEMMTSPWRTVTWALVLATLSSDRIEAQAVTRYEGSVTNYGSAAFPHNVGITGTLRLDGQPVSGGSAYLTVGSPLGGSGSIVDGRASGDTIALLSVSASGDQVAWYGQHVGAGLRGEYYVLGGPFEGQGGRWYLSHVAGPRLPGLTSATSETIATLDSLTAPFRGLPEPSLPTEPAVTVRAPAIPTTSSDSNGFVVLAIFAGGALIVFLAVKFLPDREVVEPVRDHASSRPGPTPRKPGKTTDRASGRPMAGYGIPCPICSQRPIQEARQFWFLHGFVLFARYGEKTLMGCRECVRKKGLETFGINLLGGWWCIPWGLGTPFVALQNLLSIFQAALPNTIETVLRNAGLNPAELRLDSEGFTADQRRLIDGACYVLASAMWADGSVAASERQRALAILQQFSDGHLDEHAAGRRLDLGREVKVELLTLPFELRETLLHMALDVALADGQLAMAEIVMLHGIADRLGLGSGAVEALLDEIMGTTSHQERASGQQRRTRAPHHDDIGRATIVLGVHAHASMHEIKQAWRQLIIKHHPDRAGKDKKAEAEMQVRAKEINWAYNVLQTHATARSEARV
jgi:DnaJ like chaperone protein